MSDKPVRPKRTFTAAELARLREQLQVREDEAAALLAISDRHLRRLSARGEIPRIGSGRLTRYAVDDLREWQRRNRAGGEVN